MDKKIVGMFLLIWLAGTACVSRENVAVQNEVFAITEMIDISALKPEISKLPLWAPNAITMDRNGNIYILDMPAHRVMKYSPKGLHLAQIGSIGQGKENLFNPWGVAVENNSLYILNEEGSEVKIFDVDGCFQSSFKVIEAWYAHSICVSHGVIYLNAIQKVRPAEKAEELIFVYSENGKMIRKMGRVIKCNSLAGYWTFNQIIMSASDKGMFWAFVYHPSIWMWRKDGAQKEINLALESNEIPEIGDRAEKAKNERYDLPETEKMDTDLKMNVLIYCNGFGIDQSEQLYYAFYLDSRQQSKSGIKSIIFVFNQNLRLMRKIIPQFMGESLIVSHLLFGPNDIRYGLGIVKGKTLLFKF